MANRRMLATDMFEDEFIGTLSFLQRLVWTGIIVVCADDQGRFQNSPALMRAKIFPFDDVSLEDIARTVEILTGEKKLFVYEAGGKSLCQITSWWTYQTPSWASPSKYDPPPGWVDRTKYHAAGNKIIIQNWDEPGGWVSDDPQASSLHSPLPGDLPGELPGCIKEDEVNGEVKHDSESKEEAEEEEEVIERASAPAASAAIDSGVLSDREVMKLYTDLTGLAAMPESSRVAIISALRGIAKRFDSRAEFKAWLEECRDAWRSRRYNLTNAGWITDWALQGCIPKSKELKAAQPDPPKRYDEGLYSEFIDNA